MPSDIASLIARGDGERQDWVLVPITATRLSPAAQAISDSATAAIIAALRAMQDQAK